jgi:hypothetical protein
MVKLVIAAVLLAHGIGHSIGILRTLGLATVNPQWDGRSWLLSGPVAPSAANILGMALWAVAMVGFISAAAIVMGWLPVGWWQPVAVISSIASLAGLVIFPLAFPTFSTIAALVVDAIVLAAVLWFRWTPADLTT